MVLYEGEDLNYLYDVGTLNVTELRGNKAVRQSVGLDEYLSGSENGVKLDPNLYSQLTMEEAAHVYYCAIRHQDKETMRDLYSGSTVEWYVYRREKYASYGIWFIDMNSHPYIDAVYFAINYYGGASGGTIWDVYFDDPYEGDLSDLYYFSIEWTSKNWEINQFPGW